MRYGEIDMRRIPLKTKIQSWSYDHLAKPIFFAFDPEFIHDSMLTLGNILGQTSATRWTTKVMFDYENPALSQTLAGINFINPIGLAAGFDKNAKIVNILPDVGFGFAEIGSITKESFAGNSGKRLTRLPKSNAIVVNYGLANKGVEEIAKRLESSQLRIPFGTSIAPTNSQKTNTLKTAVKDCEYSYDRLKNVGDYTTLNLSCPNTGCDQPFMQTDWLEALLKTVGTIKTKKPIFIKVSPDHSLDHMDKIFKIADKHGVAGIICTNLTKPRNNTKILDKNVPISGGISGKVVEELSNKLIDHIYQKYNDRFIIVGCGGVFTAEDAYQKIKLGASLIQLITGMIFKGPQTIGAINFGLVELLKQDGFDSIEELIESRSKKG